jgi:hypothetical protein
MRHRWLGVLMGAALVVVGCAEGDEATEPTGTDPPATQPAADEEPPGPDPTDEPDDTDDLAVACEAFTQDEISTYITRGLSPDHELTELTAAVVSPRPSGVDCRWTATLDWCPSGADSCQSSDHDVWMQATVYPLDEVLDDEWTTPEAEPSADAIQGSIWFDHDAHRVALFTGFQTIGAPEGNPSLIADVLRDLMLRVQAEL